MSNGSVLNLITGGQPIQTDSDVSVTLDQSVYVGIAAAVLGVMLLIIIWFLLKRYA